MSNVLIHRYLPQCKTVAQPPGLADFLKGTAYLYQQSLIGKREDVSTTLPTSLRSNLPVYELVVDFSHHPMGVFILPREEHVQKYGELLRRNDVEVMECFNQNRPIIRNIVATLQNHPETLPPVTYAVCHEPYEQFDSNDFVLDPSAQSFMKSVLNFTPELRECADHLLEQLYLKDQEYVVIHLRMGDKQSGEPRDNAQQLSKIEDYIQNILIPQWGNRILVISDSFYTKKYLCTKYRLRGTDIQPVHMGEAKRFLNRSESASPTDIGNTLLEFMLMSRSQTIYVYSVYGWNSGFSKLCGHIYQIPYVPMLAET